MITSNPDVIRFERLKNGLSLRALGEQAGVHYSTVSQLERSNAAVNPKTAKGIADALKLPIEQLFTIIGNCEKKK